MLKRTGTTQKIRAWTQQRLNVDEPSWLDVGFLVAVTVALVVLPFRGADQADAGPVGATESVNVADPGAVPVWAASGWTTSRYISWLSGDRAVDAARAYTTACDGDTSNGGTSVIAFGRQVAGGTRSFSGPSALYDYGHLSAVVDGYARGLTQCGERWQLVVATSNYLLDDPGVSYARGREWGQFIDSLTHIPGVSIVGGVDLEPGWGSRHAAESWLTGYRTSRSVLVVNASADGCPQYGDRGECANGWTVDDLAQFVWSRDRDLALPQIYRHDGAMARQWGVISRAGQRLGYHPKFAGAMTQSRACTQVDDRHCPQLSLLPEDARRQLQSEVGEGIHIPFGTDVGWG